METVRITSIACLAALVLGCGVEGAEELATYAGAGGKADSTQSLPPADAPGGIEAVKQWAHQRVQGAEQSFSQAGRSRMGSPYNWADEVVYQIQVDRFADGDPSNNHKNISAHQAYHESGDQRGLPDYHHGGDLQGIINRLDYLSHLGVTTLWITPVLMSTASYHGYCTSDFSRIDPNFGDAATLRRLTTEAHNRGMRVVLDVVVNHMCSNDVHYAVQTPYSSYFYNQCVNDLNWKRWNKNTSIRGQCELVFGPDFFPPLRNKHFFARCGHKSGDFAGFGPGAMFGDFTTSMLDFETMNWDFQDIFTELHKYWIAYADLDGFRVDAAKHVTEDFLAAFSTKIRAYASSIGKHNFLLVGEVAASTYEQALRVGKMRSNHADPWDMSASIPASLRSRLKNLKNTYLAHGAFPYPGLNAIYDFGHSGTAVDVMHQGRAPLGIKQWFWAGGEGDCSQLSSGFSELAANGQPLLNWNVVEIHDWPRFAQQGRNMGQLKAALGYLGTTHGVPVLYYGVEQGLDGHCPDNSIQLASSQAHGEVVNVCNGWEHSRYRQDMFVTGPWRLRSLVPQIDALAQIGSGGQVPGGNDPYLDTSHHLFRYLRGLLAIRASCKSLRRGAIYFRAAHQSSQGGLLAFSRIYKGDEIVVLVNTSGQSIPVSTLHVDAAINGDRQFQTYRNLLNGYETASVGTLGNGIGLYFTSASGAFSLGAYQVAVFVHDGNVRPFDAGLGVHRCWH